MKGLLTKDFFLMCENKLFFIMFIIISSMFITINSTSLLFVLGYDVFLCTFMSISTINYDSMDNGMPFIMTLPLKRKIYIYYFGITFCKCYFWCGSMDVFSV